MPNDTQRILDLIPESLRPQLFIEVQQEIDKKHSKTNNKNTTMSERLIDTLPAHLKEQFKKEFDDEQQEATKKANVIDPDIKKFGENLSKQYKAEQERLSEQKKIK